jgi:hypothetical protein
VSLLFLLYSTLPTDSERYEKLLKVITEDGTLNEWGNNMVETGHNKYWRQTLIEGLCVIQAFHIIEKIGLDVAEIKKKFSKKTSSHLKQNINIFIIHPILKLLYQICEELDENQRKILLAYVDDHTNDGTELSKDNVHLELTFSEMMAKGVIKIGNKHKKCDLKLLADFLLDSDKLQHLYVNVKESEEKFNRWLTQKTIELITFPTSAVMAVPLNLSTSTREVSKYKVYRETVGKVLIINQKTFTRSKHKPELELEERKGSTKDCDALEQVFAGFGFTVDIEEDLERDEIKRQIKKFVQKIDEDHDSVFVCILSHGESGAVYGSDSELLEITEIKKMLTSENLNHKPKVLIVQACQGTRLVSCLAGTLIKQFSSTQETICCKDTKKTKPLQAMKLERMLPEKLLKL